MRQVNFYKNRSGRSPIEEFLDSLTGRQSQKVVWVLRLIQELEVVPRQYLKRLANTDGLWEVRIQFGNDIFRLLGFFDGDDLMILTSGFAKKTQKTPLQEIRTAEQRKRDYFDRRQS